MKKEGGLLLMIMSLLLLQFFTLSSAANSSSCFEDYSEKCKDPKYVFTRDRYFREECICEVGPGEVPPHGSKLISLRGNGRRRYIYHKIPTTIRFLIRSRSSTPTYNKPLMLAGPTK